MGSSKRTRDYLDGAWASSRGVCWDLKDLQGIPEESGLRKDMLDLQDRANAFAASFRGRLNAEDLDAQTLLSAIREFEQIHEAGMRPYFFADLRFTSDTRDHGRTQFLYEIRERWNEILRLLTFFRLEIMALPRHRIHELAEHPGLDAYRYYLHHLTLLQPHALGEKEEMIAAAKDLSGRTAFVALFDELMGSLSISISMEGEVVRLKTDEVLALLFRPDPFPRARAFEGLLKEIADQGMVFKNILNALVMDHLLDIRHRGYPTAMHKSLLANGVEAPLIEAMMGRVEGHYPLARRYFRLKARLLGWDTIRFTDQFAPLETVTDGMPFPDARDIVLEALAAFHPRFFSAAEDFFDSRRIDAEARPGKMDGAFCRSLAPSLPPFISIYYTGHVRDVMILAHEIGHGIHFLFSQQQSYLNYAPSPLLSETAATFVEIVVADHLLGKKAFPGHRAQFLASHIEGLLITVFRQTVLTRFEQAVHALRQDRFLSAEEICRCWWEENRRLYGEDVEMTPLYRWGWAYIPHFFRHSFYCYSYVFGNLLAIRLFQMCMERKDFPEMMIRLFSQGGAGGPLDMIRELGLDPGEQAFWDPPLAYLESLIESFEGLSAVRE